MSSLTITLTVNGQTVTAAVEPRTHLGDFLREHLRLTATHLGCEHGVCGACTVLIDGAPARACIALTAALDGAEVTTLEGMANDPEMTALKDSFHEQHGLQCGFCTPGMLISAWDLLRRKPELSDREIREAMSGNLCRCTGYQGIARAIRHAADKRRDATLTA
ncbi:MAG: (2Fe-2S)-binding protein [Acetobacteraceae bacterium]|nr:(2Fe-2S)-binding protein [Acetobacteraceae bacterium]